MVKRLDLSLVAPILHALPAEPPPVPAPAGPSVADLLGLAPGDAAGRRAYFDTTAQPTVAGGPALIVGGASLMDYRDTRGRRTRRALIVIPPATEARIGLACGGTSANLNAALIAAAEHGLDCLATARETLVVRNAVDPVRAERLAARRNSIKSRARAQA